MHICLIQSNARLSNSSISDVVFSLIHIYLIQSISDVYTGLMQAIGASQKVFEFIDRKPLIKPEGRILRPDKLEGRIEFRNVSFAYPTRPESLVLNVGQSYEGNEG